MLTQLNAANMESLSQCEGGVFLVSKLIACRQD